LHIIVILLVHIIVYCMSLKSVECKEERLKIHRFVKSTFHNLNSNSVEKDGTKYIRVTYLLRKGNYLHFLM